MAKAGLGIVLSLVVLSCAPAERTPSDVVLAYMEAVERADTTATLVLSTEERANHLRPVMAAYFDENAHKQWTTKILKEDIRSSVEAVVTFEQHGDTAECVLYKSGSAWQVSYCRGQ